MQAPTTPDEEPRSANAEAKADWLRLSRSGVSARRLAGLISLLGSPQAIFAAPRESLAEIDEIRPRDVDRLAEAASLDVSEDAEKLAELGVSLVTLHAEEYPKRLREVHDPPPLLYVQGELQPTDDLAVSIVGTRRCTPYGQRMTERIAGDLARRGVVVVSGLALGIDGAAHRAALQAGGRSIGVMACGLDVDYPREHRDMKRDLIESGAIVSEVPFGTPPKRERFPQRNRIVSGLSLGTVVVEAPARSGSLITAGLAVEQGREVFAVPGDVDNPRNRGSHALIRDGAGLVETADDVLEGLGVHLETPVEHPREPPPDLSADENAAFGALSFQPQHLDELTLATGLGVPAMSAALMLLEVKGLARRFPGGTFCRS